MNKSVGLWLIVPCMMVIYHAQGQHVLVHEVEQSEAISVDAGNDQYGSINSVMVGLLDPVEGGTPPFIYAWSPTEKVVNPTAPRTKVREFSEVGFILTVTDKNNCTASDTVFVDIATGLDDALEEIKVYPNPAGSYVRIQHFGKAISDIRLISMEGKLMDVSIAHDSGVTLDVSNLSSGVYTLQFVQEEKTVQRKIVIQ